MDHGNYLKLCFSHTCLPSNHTNTWGNLSIFIRPPSSLPGVVANGQPHLRWERHRTASPTRPNDTVPGVSVVFPGWANFWWSLERGLRFSLAFLVGICWKVGNYCIFKNTWYASCVVYLDFCWAGRKTHTVWEMCWHLMEWWHVKRNKKVLLADQLKVAPPVSCQSQKRPAGSHRLKPLDASQLGHLDKSWHFDILKPRTILVGIPLTKQHLLDEVTTTREPTGTFTNRSRSKSNQ